MAFSIKDVLYNKASSLIHLETEPGLGCTEPASVGLCAAVAAAARLSVMPEFAAKTIVVILPDAAERYLSSELFAGIGE